MTTNWQVKLSLKCVIFCLVSDRYLIICSSLAFKRRLGGGKSLLSPFSFRGNLGENHYSVGRHFLRKWGRYYHNFLATLPPYAHPAFKSHKARSNASCVQVSAANFTQTAHAFWTPIQVWVSWGESRAKSHAQDSLLDQCVLCRRKAFSAMLLPGQRTFLQESSLLFSDLTPDTT